MLRFCSAEIVALRVRAQPLAYGEHVFRFAKAESDDGGFRVEAGAFIRQSLGVAE